MTDRTTNECRLNSAAAISINLLGYLCSAAPPRRLIAFVKIKADAAAIWPRSRGGLGTVIMTHCGTLIC